MKLLAPLLLAACGTTSSQTLAAGADDAVLNRFNDPFEAVSADMADCPEPRGPRITAAEARVQAHHRAERGTTCWLKGECSEPNAFRYDAAIASALRAALDNAATLHPSSLWFTVQGRVVYLEGCVERAGQAADLEAKARGLPDVQNALALVRVGRGGATPYRRMN